jgi:hypothetical protein
LLFIPVRENALELREESFGVLAFRGASFLPEVTHTGSLPRGESVVDDIPVVFFGERRFECGAHSIRAP